MTEAQLDVTVDKARRPPLVTVVGEIDLANVEEFRSSLTDAADGAPAITVDLSRVSYCDSAAVRALYATAAATVVTLIAPTTGPMQALLSVTGLDQVVTVRSAR